LSLVWGLEQQKGKAFLYFLAEVIDEGQVQFKIQRIGSHAQSVLWSYRATGLVHKVRGFKVFQHGWLKRGLISLKTPYPKDTRYNVFNCVPEQKRIIIT
jgi:hypothetical protein